MKIEVLSLFVGVDDYEIIDKIYKRKGVEYSKRIKRKRDIPILNIQCMIAVNEELKVGGVYVDPSGFSYACTHILLMGPPRSVLYSCGCSISAWSIPNDLKLISNETKES